MWYFIIGGVCFIALVFLFMYNVGQQNEEDDDEF